MSERSPGSSLARLLGQLPRPSSGGSGTVQPDVASIDVDLPELGSWPEARHRVPPQALTGLVAAIGAERPLLVRGEPGVGKSHLARAAAVLLGRHFLSYTVQPYTEYQDLLWQVDHTRRLGEAQLLGAGGGTGHEEATDRLAIERFITPGPLWWAFDWAGEKPACRDSYCPEEPLSDFPASGGVVLLIDEIDKADISLCNGLLEVLGNGAFTVPGWRRRVVANRAVPPLVMITSNDSRQLPAAFLRRCVLIDLVLPTGTALVAHLAEIGLVQFPEMDHEVLITAAEQIVRDRSSGDETSRAGQAEYLDLLRALSAIDGAKDVQLDWLSRLDGAFRKTPRGVH